MLWHNDVPGPTHHLHGDVLKHNLQPAGLPSGGTDDFPVLLSIPEDFFGKSSVLREQQEGKRRLKPAWSSG